MKRSKVTKTDEVSYPTFNEYHKNRREFLKLLSLGVGGAMLAGCNDGHAGESKMPHTAGIAPPPNHPGDTKAPHTKGKPRQPDPPRLRGEPPVVKPSGTNACEVRLPGELPARTTTNQPPRLDGRMPHPRKPGRPPSATAGVPPPPKPPTKNPPKKKPSVEAFPPLGGDIAIVEP